MLRKTALSLAFALAALPAAADEIKDAINRALEAYEAGDNAFALEELTYATQLLNALKQDSLISFLPEPLDGWTREIDDEVSNSLSFTGGGSGASATYRSEEGRFEITFIADSPMVLSMAALFNNPALAGRPIRIGRTKIYERDGQLMGLIANRILVQGEGKSKDALLEHLKTIDFEAMEGFGS